MPPGDRADEAQAETVSGGRTAGLEADKTAEHALPVRLWNARPLIRYFKDRLPIVGEDPNFDTAATGIFKRVVEKIGERLR